MNFTLKFFSMVWIRNDHPNLWLIISYLLQHFKRKIENFPQFVLDFLGKFVVSLTIIKKAIAKLKIFASMMWMIHESHFFLEIVRLIKTSQLWRHQGSKFNFKRNKNAVAWRQRCTIDFRCSRCEHSERPVNCTINRADCSTQSRSHPDGKP